MTVASHRLMNTDATELTVGGSPRKVIIQANRNGFLYVLERATGKLLAANKFVKVTWAERIDMTTGQ